MTESAEPLIVSTSKGLYCPQGNFFIDPWKAVPHALITHAHSDHARSGSSNYLTVSDGLHVLKSRIGAKQNIQTLVYGEKLNINGVMVSFHSAGHVLGSAQIRLEHKGRVWVVSGDYKTKPDATCAPFELVKCHCFITESTFGLPIYHWPDADKLANEMNSWWHENRKAKRCSIIFAYSFGKAQRVLSMLDPTIGPLYVHGTVHKLNQEYIASGVNLPACGSLGTTGSLSAFAGAMIVAPPSVAEGSWIESFGDYSAAFASGWMCIRANRKRQMTDRGFTLSDHADWDELLEVIHNTGAEEIIVTHGYAKPLVRYLKEQGLRARSFNTEFEGERDPQPRSNSGGNNFAPQAEGEA